MGSLTLPSAGVIYLDTPPFIYTVEKHKDFYPLFITNDSAFRRVTGLNVVVLSELI
jgi:hypothetical protein